MSTLVTLSTHARPAARLFLLSAGSQEELHQLAEALRQELRNDPSAYGGAAVQRIRGESAAESWRAAVLCRDRADADAALGPEAGRLRTAQVSAGAARPVVLMFPGLGEHYVNMGLGLYRTEPVFRAAIDRAAELLHGSLRLDLRAVLYPEPTDAAASPSTAPVPGAPRKLDLRRMLGRGPATVDAAEQRLQQTELLQPILFVVEWALAELVRSWGLGIRALIGYSLGEYVAACIAGVLSLEDALTLVAQRAQLIAQLPAGQMLAVSLPESAVLPILTPDLSLSAVNGHEYCVVGGPPDAIAALEKRLAEQGAVTRRVKTTHAFHSQMMAPIVERLTELCRGYSFHPPRIPYVSNVSGALITDAQATSASYLSTHLCSPVRCADGFHSLHSADAPVFVEVGPGQSMCSLAILPRLDDAQGRPIAIPLMRSAYDAQEDAEVLLHGLGQLWLASAAADWERFPSRRVQPTAGSPGVHDAPIRSAPAAERRPAADPAIVEPIARVWSELFRGVQVTAHSHFRDLGGNSLTATRLVQRLRKVFGIPIPLQRILQAATPGEQAILIASLLHKDDSASTADAQSVPEPFSPLLQTVLPNGLSVFHQSAAETAHFYRDIFEHRSYLTGGLVIPDGGTVFDVGANIGMFSLFASREARGVQIYSFEPAPPLFAILEQNATRHQIGARLFNYGLSNAERSASFTFYPSSSGMSSFYADLDEEKQILRAIIHNQQRTAMPGMDQIAQHADDLLAVRFEAKTFSCRLRRLSDVMAEQRVSSIDLLKVDVQKAELEVLQGIADADWPKIRQLAVEVHDTQGRLAQMRALLEARGYSVLSVQDELYQGTNLFNLFATRK